MKKIFLVTCLSLFIFTLPFVSLAQTNITPPTGTNITPPTPTQNAPSYKITIPNPLKASITDIPSLLRVIISDIIIPIGGVVAVLMIMWAGFLYVTARGKPEKIKEAHQALLWGSIGAAILLGAYVIAQVIQNTIHQITS